MKIIRIAVLALGVFFAFGVQNTNAQSPSGGSERDTICVETRVLERIRDDAKTKQQRIEALNRLVNNFERQVATFERLRSRDSLMLSLTDQRLEIRDEKIELHSDEINRLNSELEQANRRKWLYYLGGVGTIVLSSVVLNQATAN